MAEKRDAMLWTGVAGSVLAALCCFTPLLVVGLGALGLSTALAWLDIVLLPLLALFLALTGFALWRGRRR